MRTKLIEVTNKDGGGINWGKFLIGVFDEEWDWRSTLPLDPNVEPTSWPLMAQLGWGRQHILVLDLATGEGAIFMPVGSARHDLNRTHAVWVCPMFEPFLVWLYEQPLDLDALPSLVEFTDKEAPSAFRGYRRAGPAEARTERLVRAAETMDLAWSTYMETDIMDHAVVAIGELREALALMREEA